MKWKHTSQRWYLTLFAPSQTWVFNLQGNKPVGCPQGLVVLRALKLKSLFSNFSSVVYTIGDTLAVRSQFSNSLGKTKISGTHLLVAAVYYDFLQFPACLYILCGFSFHLSEAKAKVMWRMSCFTEPDESYLEVREMSRNHTFRRREVRLWQLRTRAQKLDIHKRPPRLLKHCALCSELSVHGEQILYLSVIHLPVGSPTCKEKTLKLFPNQNCTHQANDLSYQDVNHKHRPQHQQCILVDSEQIEKSSNTVVVLSYTYTAFSCGSRTIFHSFVSKRTT